MYIPQCALVFIALTIDYVNSWDLAVTFGDQLEFYGEGNKTIAEDVRFRELTALAYDAVHNILLFVDKQNDNASIFSYNIATKEYTPRVRRWRNENIQGLAFDPVTSKLFWTDWNKKSIFYISLAIGSKNNDYGNLLIEMVDGRPQGIAVDSCRGYVYWTNANTSNPTIERARFNGTERKTIVDNSKTSIFSPVSIALDQQTGRIYWADDREGRHFSIDSSDLEGQDVRTEYSGFDHEPISLTVSKDYIYWAERGYNTIHRLPKKKNTSIKVEPEAIVTKLSMSPGIAANYQIADQTYGSTECQKLSDMVKNQTVFNDTLTSISPNEGLFCLHGEVLKESACKCSSGYIGDRCEKHVCDNYCLQGDCSMTSDGKPSCRCANGFAGLRCEVDPCHSYCLNNAACSVDLINQNPQCRCQGDFEGVRCETRKPDLCHKFCLNEGTCSLDTVTHTPLCRCQLGFKGERCEMNETAIEKLAAKIPELTERRPKTSGSCNCTQSSTSKLVTSSQIASDDIVIDSCDSWDSIRDPILMALGILCGLLCVACAVLITRVLQLKRRPRIRKRIIVNKNVTPLTARPDQCEITIENCCNMNVCETPCFEPRATIRPSLRDAKPGKEEKSNLIANMEQSDDLF